VIDLYALADERFSALTGVLRWWDLSYRPQLKLIQGQGLLCHYSRKDMGLYVCLPDQPVTATLLMAAMSCQTESQLNQLYAMLIPWLLAHEVAHHLRHFQGIESGSWWYEEQVCNLFACVTSPQSEILALQQFLDRAISGLYGHIPTPDIVKAGYSTQPEVNWRDPIYTRRVVDHLRVNYSHHILRGLYCSLVWLQCQLHAPPDITPAILIQRYFRDVDDPFAGTNAKARPFGRALFHDESPSL
jgi:hypothetical protein